MENIITVKESYAEVSLSRGKVALIDIEDISIVKDYQWHAHRSSNNGEIFYAEGMPKGTGRSYKQIRMHVFFLGERPGHIIDHENRNGLDNRRHNIRFATHNENMANRAKQSSLTSSRFKGVHWNAKDKKWYACIGINGEHIIIGTFDYEEKAAKTYDKEAFIAWGNFARLNFPELPSLTG